jgi:hypothetical protein
MNLTQNKIVLIFNSAYKVTINGNVVKGNFSLTLTLRSTTSLLECDH